jgi:hypothetical protein
MLATIVSAHPSLAQIFYLVAAVLVGIVVVCGLLNQPVPFAPLLVPAAIFFVALGLFFAI